MIGVCVCGVLLLYFLLWLVTALCGHNPFDPQSISPLCAVLHERRQQGTSIWLCLLLLLWGLSRAISLCFWGPSQRFASMSLCVFIAGPFRELSLKTCITFVLAIASAIVGLFLSCLFISFLSSIKLHAWVDIHSVLTLFLQPRVSIAASIVALLNVPIVIASDDAEVVSQRSAEGLFDSWICEPDHVQILVSFLSKICFSRLQFQLCK